MAKKIDLNGLEFYKGKENAMIADEYSSSSTYAVGDYVYHAGTLYKCTTAITTAEAWTSGHWAAAKLAEDVTSQSEKIVGKEYGGAYFDIMGQGTVSISNRYITVDKNKVSVTANGTSSSYRCVNLFGIPAGIDATFNSANLSGQTFYNIDFNYTDGYDLRIATNWLYNYPDARNYICVATKNPTTNEITKVAIHSDKNTAGKYRYRSLFELSPEIKENGNFALFYESRNTSYPNTLTYSLELFPLTFQDIEKVTITDVPLIRGAISYSTGESTTDNTNRARTSFYLAFPDAVSSVKISGTNGYQISLRYYNIKTLAYLRGDSSWSSEQTLTWNKNEALRIVVRNSTNTDIANTTLLKDCVKIEYFASNDYPTPSVTGFEKNGNPTVVAAKTLNYSDGTQPKVDYYVVLSPLTRILYKTKDFGSYERICRVPFAFPEIYSYATTNSDDIIAVFNVQALYDPDFYRKQNGTDDCRRNPFVFLKSENYSIMHEVDFGNNVKPTGWLSNSSYVNTDDGFVFCEYTRTLVATCNAWKVTGDITNASNWSRTLTLTLSGLATGIKHFHCLLNDPFTGYYYLASGDDDDGAKTYYSTDQGSTWTLLFEGEEKYSRYVNLIFTEQYIYWATDSKKADTHYLFRTVRDNDNIISFPDIEELEDLNNGSTATYATVYLEPLGKLFIADRRDADDGDYVDIKVYDITSDTLTTLKRIYSASNSRLAFRCLYTDYVSRDGRVVCGYGSNYINNNGGYANWVAAFGNIAKGDARGSCNNLVLYFTDSAVTLDTIT